jgi:hypothetical protein
MGRVIRFLRVLRLDWGALREFHLLPFLVVIWIIYFPYSSFSPFLLWKYGKRIRMSSKFAHKSHTPGGGGANANGRGNDGAVSTGANDLEETKSNDDGEKERTSVESSLRPQPSRKPSRPLSDAEMAAEREGEAVVEYDELPAAVQVERAVERLAGTMSIQKSDSEETRVVRSRSGER